MIGYTGKACQDGDLCNVRGTFTDFEYYDIEIYDITSMPKVNAKLRSLLYKFLCERPDGDIRVEMIKRELYIQKPADLTFELFINQTDMTISNLTKDEYQTVILSLKEALQCRDTTNEGVIDER